MKKRELKAQIYELEEELADARQDNKQLRKEVADLAHLVSCHKKERAIGLATIDALRRRVGALAKGQVAMAMHYQKEGAL